MSRNVDQLLKLLGNSPTAARGFLDCCHSGTGLDLAYRWSPYVEANGKGEWQLDGGGYYSEADVRLG